MAVNAYLVIDTVEGPSTSKSKTIDIMSFSFGASQPMTVQHGGAKQSGRVNLSDVSIMKEMDKTSPLLFEACCSGDYYKSAELTYCKALGKDQQPYIKYEMSKVYVTSVGHSGSSENPTESVTFAFEELKVSYNSDKDGNQEGWVTKGYNIATLVQV